MIDINNKTEKECIDAINIFLQSKGKTIIKGVKEFEVNVDNEFIEIGQLKFPNKVDKNFADILYNIAKGNGIFCKFEMDNKFFTFEGIIDLYTDNIINLNTIKIDLLSKIIHNTLCKIQEKKDNYELKHIITKTYNPNNIEKMIIDFCKRFRLNLNYTDGNEIINLSYKFD